MKTEIDTNFPRMDLLVAFVLSMQSIDNCRYLPFCSTYLVLHVGSYSLVPRFLFFARSVKKKNVRRKLGMWTLGMGLGSCTLKADN